MKNQRFKWEEAHVFTVTKLFFVVLLTWKVCTYAIIRELWNGLRQSNVYGVCWQYLHLNLTSNKKKSFVVLNLNPNKNRSDPQHWFYPLGCHADSLEEGLPLIRTLDVQYFFSPEKENSKKRHIQLHQKKKCWKIEWFHYPSCTVPTAKGRIIS
jgi:hypothetical protein